MKALTFPIYMLLCRATYLMNISYHAASDVTVTGQNFPFHLVAFYSSECPVCKKTAILLAGIVKEYVPRGLRLTLVFPGNFERKNKVERFCKEYRLSDYATIVLDKNHAWVNQYHATITPEFFLINQHGEIMYSGALDDRFVKVGVQKPEPEQNYLRDALRALEEGKEIVVKRTEPVGCFISK